MDKPATLLVQAEATGNAIRICEQLASKRRAEARLELDPLKKAAHEAIAVGLDEAALALRDEVSRLLAGIAKGMPR